MGADPLTVAAIGTTVGGGLLQAKGQRDAGRAAAEQKLYTASVLKHNKARLDMAADDTLEAGKDRIQERSVQTAQTISNQRTGLAGAGIVVDQDTAVALADDAARIGKLDEQAIADEANRQALDLRLEGQGMEIQAQGSERAAGAARRAGRSAAVGTLISTAGTVAGKWDTWFP